MVRKVLLVGGVLSSLYLIAIDRIAALRYPDYHNYADQVVSELFAAGATTRTLMVWLSNPYNVPSTTRTSLHFKINGLRAV